MPTTLPETVRVERHFEPEADRYCFDFDLCHYRKGWAQCDTKQDASYYGTWANPLTLQVVCYCEGDVTIYRCDTLEDFAAVVRNLAEWSIDNGYGFTISTMCRPDVAEAIASAGLGDLLH